MSKRALLAMVFSLLAVLIDEEVQKVGEKLPVENVYRKEKQSIIKRIF